MAVISRSLIVLAFALSAFAASATEPVTATRVARGGGNDGNGGGDGGSYGPGGGSNGGGPDGPGNGNGGGSHSGGGGGPGEPHHPEPSHRPPSRPYRRALNTLHTTEIADEICPGDSYGCPVAPAGSLTSLPNSLDDWISQGFYCIDRTADLTDCGGCAALDAKHDCTRITGAKSVACVAGSCVVDSCLQNFTLDNNSCTTK